MVYSLLGPGNGKKSLAMYFDILLDGNMENKEINL
jgi:hypothetical protein